jgi:hypothetical protein
MAAGRVIHFGSDDCNRVQALRQVGYEVRVSESLDRLRLDLEGAEGVDAVMVAEGARRTTERAAAMVRHYSGAPLILFRRTNAPLSVKLFDRVYSSSIQRLRGCLRRRYWLIRVGGNQAPDKPVQTPTRRSGSSGQGDTDAHAPGGSQGETQSRTVNAVA